MIPRPRHLLRPLALLALAASAFAADAPTPAPAMPAASAPATPDAAEQLPQNKFTDSVAATVNGKIITLAELDKAIESDVQAIFADVDAKYGDDPVKAKQIFSQQVDALGVERLKAMVDRLLIIQEFTDKGNKVPTAYLDRQFEDNMTTMFHDDRVAFLKQLAKDGMSELDYRKQIEEDDEIGWMVDQLHSSATGLSPDRIKAYYEKNKEDYHVQASLKVRQIVLAPVADSPIAEQAAKIVQEARLPGANFLELAQKYSSDPRARAGDLPDQTYTSDNKLLPEVQQAVFKLEPGEVSDPVITHDPKTNATVIFIFICDEKIAEGYQPLELDKVRLDIEGKLSKQDQDQATEKWLEGLRGKAYIKYDLSSSN
jgi:parvulin-like peptidyl-prolyl isomerase